MEYTDASRRHFVRATILVNSRRMIWVPPEENLKLGGLGSLFSCAEYRYRGLIIIVSYTRGLMFKL